MFAVLVLLVDALGCGGSTSSEEGQTSPAGTGGQEAAGSGGSSSSAGGAGATGGGGSSGSTGGSGGNGAGASSAGAAGSASGAGAAGGASGAGGLGGGGSSTKPQTVDQVSVPSSGQVVFSKVSLAVGVSYTLRASGTIKVNNGTPSLGDAEYAFDPLIDGCLPGGVDLGIDVDGSAPGSTKSFSWGPYQPTHVYERPFVGKGGPVGFRYNDCSYNDNSGNLTVEIIQP